MKKQILFIFYIVSAITLFAAKADKMPYPMLDPSIDNPDKQWSYGGRTTAVIGVPFVTEPVQVTYDGAIYTRHGELAFFSGKSLNPIMIRQRKFMEGWIPVIVDQWNEGNIIYSIQLFSSALDLESGETNAVQYARFSATNSGSSDQEAVLGAFFRGSGEDYRLGGTKKPIKGRDRFQFDSNHFMRNGKTVYSFNGSPQFFSAPHQQYEKSYKAYQKGIKNNSATGLTLYNKTLQPGESFSACFRMNRIPENNSSKEMTQQEYELHLNATIKYWKELIGPTGGFSIPEERINESWKASLVNLILATRTQGSTKRQGSGLPYDSLFLNDFVDMRLAYDVYGLTDFVRVNIPWLKNNQLADGMFMDSSLSHGEPLLASHGQALYSMSHHALMSNDINYAEEVFPLIEAGTQWIISEHNTNTNGLLRPSTPYDNEMIKGCYTSHNLWGLTGFRNAIRVARMLEKNELADQWETEQQSYSDAVQKAIDWTWNDKGYISSGLYPYITGPAARSGFVEYRTDQEWENNMLVYPSEVLSKDDPRVRTTLDTIRTRKYREGVMSYRNGQHLHQYITLNQAHQYMAIGDQQQALTDLYHVLLHNGPTHEGFENLTDPWGNRTPYASCPPPHGWAAAKTALFIRNMMVREEGGLCGLNEEERGLVLFSLVAPKWTEAGQKIEISKAPVEHGNISAVMSFESDGYNLELSGQFHRDPAFIAIAIPWFKEIISIKAKGGTAELLDDRIMLGKGVTFLQVNWKDKAGAHHLTYQNLLKSYRSEFGFVENRDDYLTGKGQMKPFLTEDEKAHDSGELSFQLVQEAWKAEYSRRFKLHQAAGGKIDTVSPPPIK